MADRRYQRNAAPVEVDEIIDFDMPTRSGTIAPTRVSPRRSGPSGPFLAVVGVAIAAAAVIVLGLIDFRPGPEPSPRPSLAAVASSAPSEAPTETPSFTVFDPTPPPTLGPDWPSRIDMPVLSIPTDQLVSMPNPFRSDGTVPSPTPSPTGPAVGPFLYGFGSASADAIPVSDVGGGPERHIQLPLKRGEQYAGSVSDGTFLVAFVRPQNSECKAKQPWRLVAARLGTDGLLAGPDAWAEVGHGVMTGRQTEGQPDCLYPVPTNFVLGGGMLAWTSEGSGGKGSVVHVLKLGYDRVAEYATSRTVTQLAVSSEAVAWIETKDIMRLMFGESMNASDPIDWRVREVDLADAGAKARVIDIGAQAVDWPGGIALDGSAIFVSIQPRDGGRGRLVREDGSGVQTIDDGSNGRSCGVTATYPGGMLLSCWWDSIVLPGPDAGSTTNLSLPVIWTADQGLRALALGDQAPVGAWPMLQSGYLLLYGNQDVSAVPMTVLGAP